VSNPSPPSSSLGAEMSIEHEREAPDDRSVSPLPGQGAINNVPVTPDSQMAPPPKAVGIEVKAIDIKLSPRPSLRRRGSACPEDHWQSPVRGSETKLRILSVEVRYTAIMSGAR